MGGSVEAMDGAFLRRPTADADDAVGMGVREQALSRKLSKRFDCPIFLSLSVDDASWGKRWDAPVMRADQKPLFQEVTERLMERLVEFRSRHDNILTV